jgi:hypothetical protein
MFDPPVGAARTRRNVSLVDDDKVRIGREGDTDRRIGSVYTMS